MTRDELIEQIERLAIQAKEHEFLLAAVVLHVLAGAMKKNNELPLAERCEGLISELQMEVTHIEGVQ